MGRPGQKFITLHRNKPPLVYTIHYVYAASIYSRSQAASNACRSLGMKLTSTYNYPFAVYRICTYSYLANCVAMHAHLRECISNFTHLTVPVCLFYLSMIIANDCNVSCLHPSFREFGVNFGLWFVFATPAMILALIISWVYLSLLYCDDRSVIPSGLPCS